MNNANKNTLVSNLYNSAYLGVLLYEAVDGYEKENSDGMPFAVAMIILPFLHLPHLADRCSPRIDTRYVSWVADNADILMNFDKRVNAMSNYSREAIVFMMTNGYIKIDDQGALHIIKKIRKYDGDGVAPERKLAQKIGRWFAHQPMQTLFMCLQIRP